VVLRGGSPVTLLREGGEVALSSAGGPAGEIALAADGAQLLPFEGMGVDASWELQLPKAAHAFDYRNIADILFTIEYTALSSAEYRQHVIQTLASDLRAARPFSLRAQFAESWYELHNAEPGERAVSVRFQTRPEDFPTNLGGLTIEDVALRLVPSNGERVDLEGVQLRFVPAGRGASSGAEGGPATTVDGIISTRQSSGGTWSALKGLPPVGEWTLTLPEAARERFRGDQIADLLLVVSYAGRAPAWPA
jgi:hypothetical protein